MSPLSVIISLFICHFSSHFSILRVIKDAVCSLFLHHRPGFYSALQNKRDKDTGQERLLVAHTIWFLARKDQTKPHSVHLHQDLSASNRILLQLPLNDLQTCKTYEWPILLLRACSKGAIFFLRDTAYVHTYMKSVCLYTFCTSLATQWWETRACSSCPMHLHYYRLFKNCFIQFRDDDDVSGREGENYA